MATKIPWTNETWNFIGGCGEVSAGCRNCAARRSVGNRFFGLADHPLYKGTVEGGKWTGVVQTCLDVGRPDILEQPRHWRTPRMIFVEFMGDLFHPKVPFSFIERVMRVIEQCPQHTFQILTKRSQRMLEYFSGVGKQFELSCCPNLWLGVSVENQKTADERIPDVLAIPGAAVRFVSAEPQLGALDLLPWLADVECENCDWKGFGGNDTPDGGTRKIYKGDKGWNNDWDDPDDDGVWVCPKCGTPDCEMSYSPHFDPYAATDPRIDWVIIGAESGPGRRPCKEEWVQSLIGQCDAAGTPVFVKQMDINGKLSRKPEEWPEWARRRDMPAEAQSREGANRGRDARDTNNE